MDEIALLRCGLVAARAITADQPFETELTETLRRVVGADSTGLNVWRGRPHAAAAVTVAGIPPLPASEYEAWTRQSAEHPYFAHLLATGARAYRVTDLMASHRFEQTPIYRELLAHYGLRYHLLMTLRLTRHDLVFVSLLRSLYDFSDREVVAVGRLRGPLSAALEYQAEVRAIQVTMARSDQPGLSPRERQVLELVTAGCTNDQAARRLGISSRTVRKHLESVFAKAQVPCRTAAVAWWSGCRA